MRQTNYPDDWPDIDTVLYNRSVKLFRAVKNLLSVNFELYADTQVFQGDIFLFNHFSRFETFIPQFLIFEKTGAYSCAIASGEFFKEENIISNYLKEVGVYPHNHPNLFPMLAGQILRGRKVIIFPEGGMVKDRRVIDKKGKYSIYSRITGNRRKHHTGPAVLGQGVETVKSAIRYAFKKQDIEKLQQWKELLMFNSLDELMAAALKPTLIVPANITFYPIRSSENLLFKSVELFSSKMSLRQTEELLIEGNILLKDTDMDIRMGNPINPCCVWGRRTHYLMRKVAPDINDPAEVFKFKTNPRNWKEWMLGNLFFKNAKCSRDEYMKEIYANVTVNLSHLASTLIMNHISKGQAHISKSHFCTVLYIAIKNLQKNTVIYLHDSLLNPEEYSDLIHGVNVRFENFIIAAKEAELIAEEDECFHFLPKLLQDHDFDSIRLENPIAVYNNEAAPLKTVQDTLQEAEKAYEKISPYQLAAWHFEDEILDLSFEQQLYSKAEEKDSKEGFKTTETAVKDPSPFFIRPKLPNGKGVLLIHGLLASPAEVIGLGQHLAEQGYTVMGVRIKGHGTSPYALRDLSYEEWFESVQKGFRILKVYCPKVFVIGFSTGGALASLLAAENHPEIIGLIAVAVPMKFVNPAFMLVPLLHNTNTLVHWVSSLEGVKPFIDNNPEHPDINYCNIPIRALYELRRLIQYLEVVLPDIQASTLLIYGNKDPIVSVNSADTFMEKLGAERKKLLIVESERHGILMENIDHTWEHIDNFLSSHHFRDRLPDKPQNYSLQETSS